MGCQERGLGLSGSSRALEWCILWTIASGGTAALRDIEELMKGLLEVLVGQKDHPWRHQLQGGSQIAYG